MGINQGIMTVMAFGVVLGGVDRMLGNRFGFGEKFESGFRMLGPVGLSMAGIICLAPLLSSMLGGVVRPLCHWLGMDPSIFASILSIDMGGYPLAMELAEDPQLGRFCGVIVSSVFGCTIVFTIPVGLSAITQADRPYFTRGILLGFLAMPFSILAGGLVMGLSLGTILWNTLPVLLIALVLAIGVIKWPQTMMKGFGVFAGLIRIVSTFGLVLAAVTQLTGLVFWEQMPPLWEAMKTVCSICVVMLGSMPLAELIQRLMKVPFSWIREKTGLNGTSTTGLLLGMVSATPTLAMIPEMDRRGQVVCSCCLVCYLGVFGSHLAYTMDCEPELVPALLATKLVGGVATAAIALFATRETKKG